MDGPRAGDAVSPILLVGPVVGLVTDATARALFEFEHDGDVTFVVRVAEGGSAKTFTRRFTGEIPGCAVFDGLAADTRYIFGVQGLEVTGSFRTRAAADVEAVRPSRVLVCSCDRGVARRGKKDMYDVMYDEIVAGRVDVVVRNGDQVYADSAFKECLKLLETQGMVARQREDMMLRLYQAIYRRTWSAPTAAKCYANASHIMLLDDHEIRNDWGTFKHDDDRTHVEYTAGTVGKWAYYLYQRQLWDGALNEGNYREYTPATETGIFRVGGTGVVIVDSRGSRSWGRVDAGEVGKGVPKSWLGRGQWAKLRGALEDENGTLAGAKSLVLIHSTPPVYIGSKSSRRVGRAIGPQEDKMGFGLYPEEQASYLDLIWEWSRKHDSEVTLVGGDLHHSMHTRIFKADTNPGAAKGIQKVVHQVVASPLSNNPPPQQISCCIRTCFLRGTVKLDGVWRAEHSDFMYERNFLKITSNGNRVDLAVHTAKFPSGLSIKEG